MKDPFIIFLCLFFCFSCQNQKGEKQKTRKENKPAKTYPALKKGKVLKKVPHREYSTESYALYLPSGYTREKRWPVLFLFDAHARGVMAVQKYDSLAGQYGMILLASNNAKNSLGEAEIDRIARHFLNEGKARFSIDPKRIYTGGFSGGARLACYQAIINNSIDGVIGCGAGFPGDIQNYNGNFSYYGIAGYRDFNYLELNMLDSVLDHTSIDHAIRFYQGKHQWPPAEEMEKAFIWLKVKAMQKNQIPVNDSFLDAFANREENKAESLQKAGEFYRTHREFTYLLNALKGLRDTTKYHQKLKSIKNSAQFRKNLRDHRAILNKEKKWRQKIYPAFAQKRLAWWEKTTGQWKEKARTSGDPAKEAMYRRLMEFTGLLGFMNSNRAINQDELQNAKKLLAIYRLADPNNPDYYYLSAIYEIKNNRDRRALNYIQMAFQQGFTDIEKLKQDPRLASLHQYPRFQQLLEHNENR